MRLSEVKGKRTFELVAELIDPICNIASDDDAMKLFSGEGAIPERVRKAVPALLRGHAGDLARILYEIERSDPKYEGPDSYEVFYAEITMPQLIGGVYQVLTDSDLIPFFS